MFRRLLRLPVRSRAQVEADLREEIEAHISIGTEYLVARGVDPVTAERQTRARFADLDGQMPAMIASAQTRSTVTRRRELGRTFLRDVGFAIRQAKRAPILSLGIVLSLGFGIGASGTVYSWMQGILLHPLPAVRDVDRLITVRADRRHGFGISLDEYTEWRDQAQSVSGLAAVALGIFAMETDATRDGSTVQPIFGMFVSANYFDVLGVDIAQGRAFLAADDAPDADLVAVISHAAWQTRFGGDSGVPGRVIRLNGKPVRIIGIGPSDFGGNLAATRLDVWVTRSRSACASSLRGGTLAAT